MVVLLGLTFGHWGIMSSSQHDAQLRWFIFMWLFFPWIGLCTLLVVLDTLRRGNPTLRRWLAISSVIPIATDIALLLRPSLIARPDFFISNGLTAWNVNPGPVYPVAVAYLILATLVAFVVLLGHGFRGPRHEVIVRACLLSGVVPGLIALVVAVLTANGLVQSIPPWTPRITSQSSLIIVAVGYAVAVFRFRMLNLPPLAAWILDGLEDPVYVSDEFSRVIFANRAFCALTGQPLGALIGRERDAALPPCLAALQRQAGAESADVELTGASGRTRTFLVKRMQHKDWGGARAVVAVMRDITRRKQAERERDAQIKALQEAQAEIRQLRAFLPICSYCKKVRDDENFWHQIDHYITKHTGLLFSHGMCPECYARQSAEFNPK